MKTLKIIFKNNVFSKLVFSFCFLLSIMACNSHAQKNELFEIGTTKKHGGVDDSTNKPKISYKVNKQVDKNGNVIKYDSTYTYVYKGADGKGFSALNTDSLFNNFNSYFDSDPFKLFNQQNKEVFKNDLFFNNQFFDNSFFEKQMQLNRSFLHQFLQQMDTIDLFYLKNKPPINYQKI